MAWTRPEWFADLGAWWVPAVGPEVARNVRPFGFDSTCALRVTCSSTAWGKQTGLFAEFLTARLNAVLGADSVRQVIVEGSADS